MTFTMTEQEAKAILQLLGQMPTQNGVYPLFLKLGQQFKNAQEEPDTQSETENTK